MHTVKKCYQHNNSIILKKNSEKKNEKGLWKNLARMQEVVRVKFREKWSCIWQCRWPPERNVGTGHFIHISETKNLWKNSWSALYGLLIGNNTNWSPKIWMDLLLSSNCLCSPEMIIHLGWNHRQMQWWCLHNYSVPCLMYLCQASWHVGKCPASQGKGLKWGISLQLLFICKRSRSNPSPQAPYNLIHLFPREGKQFQKIAVL